MGLKPSPTGIFAVKLADNVTDLTATGESLNSTFHMEMSISDDGACHRGSSPSTPKAIRTQDSASKGKYELEGVIKPMQKRISNHSIRTKTGPMWYLVSLARSTGHLMLDEARGFKNYVMDNIPKGYFSKSKEATLCRRSIGRPEGKSSRRRNQDPGIL